MGTQPPYQRQGAVSQGGKILWSTDLPHTLVGWTMHNIEKNSPTCGREHDNIHNSNMYKEIILSRHSWNLRWSLILPHWYHSNMVKINEWLLITAFYHIEWSTYHSNMWSRSTAIKWLLDTLHLLHWCTVMVALCVNFYCSWYVTLLLLTLVHSHVYCYFIDCDQLYSALTKTRSSYSMSTVVDQNMILTHECWFYWGTW